MKETLPEIADEINILNLTSKPENQGLLDPYVIMKKKKDSESLAIDILTFLTGISSRDGRSSLCYAKPFERLPKVISEDYYK